MTTNLTANLTMDLTNAVLLPDTRQDVVAGVVFECHNAHLAFVVDDWGNEDPEGGFDSYIVAHKGREFFYCARPHQIRNLFPGCRVWFRNGFDKGREVTA